MFNNDEHIKKRTFVPNTKLNPVTDRDIALIERTVNSFREATGTDILTVDIAEKDQIFGYLQVADTKLRLALAVKPLPDKAYTGYLYQKFTGHLAADRGLLIADYINPAMAERLKQQEIWFIDAAGNAYINQAPLYIYVKGNKPKELPGKANYPRVFKPAGLKVVFALLCLPELVNAPYRKIAQIADVALGSVGKIMTDLKDMGYIVELNKDKRGLRKIKKLFDRWVEAYPEQLRPRLVLGRFTTPEQDWWKNEKLKQYPAYLGGELAGEYLTDYLTPEIKTVYVRENPQDFQLFCRMRKDPEGDIELLEAFWNMECDYQNEKNRAKKIAHPILVYADLLATGDPRNTEIANMIYENNIAR